MRCSWSRGGELIAGRGRVRQLSELRALVAWDGEERVGVATYTVEDGRAELVTLARSASTSAPASGSTNCAGAVEEERFMAASPASLAQNRWHRT